MSEKKSESGDSQPPPEDKPKEVAGGSVSNRLFINSLDANVIHRR